MQAKIYTNTNVYDAAQQRLAYIFSEFDNVYVSFSGGKDSGVLLNLTLDFVRKNNLQHKLGVFHLDYEAQYSATTNYVNKTYADLGDEVVPLRCCVPVKVTTCTSMYQSYWRPWDPDKRDLWVSKKPENCFEQADFDFITNNTTDYEFQRLFSGWYHRKTAASKTCVLIGIRAQESLNRFRTIVSDKNINKYAGRKWTTKIAPDICQAYPIYDWETEDVWTANARFGWDYNDLYNLMHYAGVPLHAQRVASPFLSEAKASLDLYRAIDPEIWGKLVSRVNGVNFTAIYGATKAMGWKNITKPKHFTWKQYMMFLLDTLPSETAENYRTKLETSVEFWRKRGGVLSKSAIDDLRSAGIDFKVGEKTNYKTDKLPVTMDYADDIDSKEFSLIPTYKRMCVCIMKNDHLCKYMGFSLNKKEQDRRKAAIAKYKNL